MTENLPTLASMSDALATAVEQAGRQIVSVNARRRGPATGVEWKSGVIVTADHIIERDEAITLTTPDGATHQVTVIGRDPSTDLAVLSVSGWSSEQTWTARTEIRPGQLVLAVGRSGDAGLGVSFGALSSAGPEFRTHGGGKIDRYLRPDVTFYPGFSGGPLIDVGGSLLGINTSGLAHGLPLTVPFATVDRVVDQLLTSGRVSRGYLGLRMQAVDLGAELAAKHRLESSEGLLVVGVETDGPGAGSGILVGDAIIALGGRSVAEADGVQSMLDAESVGKNVILRVIRGGDLRDVAVTVGERPTRRKSRRG